MTKIKDVLELSMFKNFKVICAGDYLDNKINAAVILEYESSRIEYDGYSYGYFVLLSYFFASREPELVHNTLRSLINKGVSGIAIKKLDEEIIPDDILALANEKHVPIMTFYDEFMEDLIININESMKTRAEYVIHEQMLNTLLESNSTPQEVKQIALEINPDFKPNILVAEVIEKNIKEGSSSVHTFFDKLMYRQYNTKETFNYSFVKYGYGMILICSFNDQEIPKTKPVSYITNLLSMHGFVPKSFHISIVDEFVPITKLGTVLSKAKYSNLICQYLNKDVQLYSELGIYKYAASLLNDKIIRDDIEKTYKTFKEIDSDHDSGLLDTLKIHVNNGLNYSKTAALCFQHTNTIRYRIKKAIQILNLDEESCSSELQTFTICCELLDFIAQNKKLHLL